MMCMQYDIDKTDEPGTYRVMLIGPPGKGRFERSKHVDLGEGDGMARSKTMMSEGELLEQQSQYIGELHSQIIAMVEVVHGVVKPLMQENKEQMKIISDSARRLAEIERDRMKFDLEMRIHADEIKIREAAEEEKTRRWHETVEVIKESGAVEGLIKALMKKINASKSDGDRPKPSSTNHPSGAAAESTTKASNVSYPDGWSDGESKKTRVEKAKKKKNRKKKPVLSKSTQEAIGSGSDMTNDQITEIFEISGMEKARENPTALMVEVLKMTIDENDQWPVIKDTLSDEQFEIFKKITESETDAEIESLLKELYALKGARRLMKLEQHLKDDQRKYIDKLTEIAVSAE